jgi:endoglucanase
MFKPRNYNVLMLLLLLVSCLAVSVSGGEVPKATALTTPTASTHSRHTSNIKILLASKVKRITPPPAPAPTPTPVPAPAPTPTPVVSTGNTAPFSSVAGLGIYRSPSSNLVYQTTNWMAQNGSDAGLQRLIEQPVAGWFGEWSGNIQTAVDSYVSAAAASGKVPVLVAYNIPNRDCGGQSAGGATAASAYQTWISGFAAGIGSRHAIVILEPDATSSDCFDAARADMLSQAISTFAASSSATVYLDAGNAAWVSPSILSSRLQQSGISHASGFSVNVSNFQTTAASTNYGTQLSSLLGGTHFVIDTSRNGNGPTTDSQWCNPAGRAVGALPTFQTGSALVDADLWIKIPGESDGMCGPAIAGITAPAAGTWWAGYALGLVRNAGW